MIFFQKRKNVFSQWKQPWVSYEVSFFSKFWWLLLFSSQNKLSNYFAHDFSSLFWIKLHPRTHSCSRTYFHMSQSVRKLDLPQARNSNLPQIFQPNTISRSFAISTVELFCLEILVEGQNFSIALIFRQTKAKLF